MIVKIEPSPRKYKRYRVILDDNTHFDFGLKTGSTFIDHKDEVKRNNYLKRHMGNPTEKHLIDNLIPSPSLFSAYLLWNTSDIDNNIKILNQLFQHQN